MRINKLLALVMVFALLLAGCAPAALEATPTPAVTPEATPTAAPEAPAVPAEPKETTVSANGFGGEMQVRVKASADEILEVELLSHKESPGVSDLAVVDVPARIVEKQSFQVDVTSGASITSGAILSAVSAALDEMGIDKAKFAVPEARNITPGTNEATDVVIVGAGLSGLMSAVQMKKYHPEVNFILVDKLSVYGGSLLAAGGALVSTDSKVHVAEGRVATTDDFVDYFKESSMTDDLNVNLIKSVYEYAGETYDWMVEFGVPFDGPVEPSSPYSSKIFAGWSEGRTLGGGGANFYRAMMDDIDGMGIDLRLNTKVTELIVENGVVTGVKVEDKEHSYEIAAKAVILSTGGFAKNKEMLNKYAPAVAGGVQDALAGSTGDGYKMTEQFGTKIVGEGSMGGFMSPQLKRVAQLPFMVNKDAQRFLDETTLYARLQRLLSQQQDGTMYLITDSQYSGLDLVKSQVETGAFAVFNTIDELAASFGLDAAVLQAEIDAYNKAVEEGVSPGFGLPVESAHAIKEAPFYGAVAVVRSFATIPGLEVNDTFQVLDGAGSPVPNLFASGELIVGNVFTYQYPGSGVGLSWAANSGRYAADCAARSLGN